MLKVCKFGGSSLSDADAIKKAADIILKDASRRFVVVSAPGKRNKTDEKITDLLYRCVDEAKRGNLNESFLKIENRYREIVKGLNIDLDLDDEFKATRDKIQNDLDEDFAASRGEYFNAKIIAKFLNFEFVDAGDIIFFNDDGMFDSDKTNSVCKARLKSCKNAVIPGFYGVCNKKVKTFSRGGSDITGSIVARGVSCDIYENWTDVNGFMTADPRIVENPKSIKYLSYNELRELSYMGASVLHSESIFPVRIANIPINIKNTFEPENTGTMIIPESKHEDHGGTLTGIAGKKDFTVILIEKSLMNAELGFARKVLSIIEDNDVSFEHIPTGIDTMSIVVADSELAGGKLEKILKKIKDTVEPDKVTAIDKMALIAIVGHGMRSKHGTAAKLFTCIAKAEINIRMIDQGSSELNIIIGVDNKDYEKCIKAVYNEFFG